MPSNHLILCCPLLFLLSVFPSFRVFYNESDFHIRWPKSWSFKLGIFVPCNWFHQDNSNLWGYLNVTTVPSCTKPLNKAQLWILNTVFGKTMLSNHELVNVLTMCVSKYHLNSLHIQCNLTNTKQVVLMITQSYHWWKCQTAAPHL